MMFLKVGVLCGSCRNLNSINVKAVITSTSTIQLRWAPEEHPCSNCRNPLILNEKDVTDPKDVVSQVGGVIVDDAAIMSQISELRQEIKRLTRNDNDLEEHIKMVDQHSQDAFSHAVKAEKLARDMKIICL